MLVFIDWKAMRSFVDDIPKQQNIEFPFQAIQKCSFFSLDINSPARWKWSTFHAVRTNLWNFRAWQTIFQEFYREFIENSKHITLLFEINKKLTKTSAIWFKALFHTSGNGYEQLDFPLTLVNHNEVKKKTTLPKAYKVNMIRSQNM